MSTIIQNNSLCLICNGSCTSSRNSIEIFNEKTVTYSGKPLTTSLANVLNTEISEEKLHSKLICKKCLKSFDELDELETRCNEITNEISKNYNISLEKSKIKDKNDGIESELFQIRKKSENSNDSFNSKIDSENEFNEIRKNQPEKMIESDKIKLEQTENVVEKPNILKRKMSTENKEMKNVKEEFADIVTQDGENYICLLCENSTTDTVAYDQKMIISHMKMTHEIRLYICDVCSAHFRKRNELSAHLDEHVAMEEGDFQCEICNRIFSNLRLFRIHKRMHAPQQKAWVCSQCGKKYSSKNLLEEHLNMHTGVRPYVCTVCGKDFASKYTFKAHEKTHEIRPRPYVCQHCPKSFLSAQNLAQHERTHSGVKEFSCHLCGKEFGSAHNLEVHSIVHTGYKPFHCRLCGKSFARKAEIRDHERIHTGERPYQCEFCGATFSQRSNLQSHKRATHYDDKRHKCDECGKAFKRRRLLDYHLKAAHTGERPFRCNICDATFVYPEHFKKHRRIHTGEKPFMCEVCGKAFNSRDNRNAHRFVHSDKKPYECLVCGAGFMRKPLLYQHMQLQGHLNDTIVVNQPRLTTDDDPSSSSLLNVNTEMEIVNETTNNVKPEYSKLYIAEHVLTEEELEGEDEKIPVEHIIIDGQQITFNDDETGGTGNNEYEEVISGSILEGGETQIVQTEDGPMQLVKVRISDDNGGEQEAWVKIVSE